MTWPTHWVSLTSHEVTLYQSRYRTVPSHYLCPASMRMVDASQRTCAVCGRPNLPTQISPQGTYAQLLTHTRSPVDEPDYQKGKEA